MQINEKALRPNVLKDLIYDIISVDEYTPKIGEDNIVLQFQVYDNYDAAYDLSSFIERAPVKVLDTEAVDIPNVDGRYDVFVEFERTAEFPVQFIKLLELLENICSGMEWKMQIYEVNDPITLDDAAIEEMIRLNTPEQITEFFANSYASVKLNENYITIQGYKDSLIYKKSSGIISESYVKELLKTSKLDNSHLSSVIGENYTVMMSDGMYICSNGDKYFLLK